MYEAFYIRANLESVFQNGKNRFHLRAVSSTTVPEFRFLLPGKVKTDTIADLADQIDTMVKKRVEW